jgi:hypothetical protein
MGSPSGSLAGLSLILQGLTLFPTEWVFLHTDWFLVKIFPEKPGEE